MSMTTDTKALRELDPSMRALIEAFVWKDEIATRNQRYIDEAAEQIQQCQRRKDQALTDRESIKEVLDRNFPNWRTFHERWDELSKASTPVSEG